ncbi:Bug family tripartite tricarboxylate transporter substrate binding protein [Massilia niastensis]|uniref:Bug family tripartite tricarboxylate transporter substrate binding protein n=1 Tax=Massilia niastensis TaxID=544911 RepID=UPI00039D812B|nr:tripartite tricarboxylate transporter substrate binding protein [Massilia niastensis]
MPSTLTTRVRRACMPVPLAALAAAACLALPAQASDYPNKPIRIVVGFAPGGGADIVARQIGNQLSTQMGQPVMIENKPGATGTIAAANVAQSGADGYSMMLASQSTMVIAPSMYPRLPFDPIKDFTPVTQLVSMPLVLVVHPSVPASTVKELVELARSGKVANYASSGSGGPQHIAGELFNMRGGVKLTHVPYKGESSALTDVVSGVVPLMFANLPVVAGFIKSGKLKTIAISSLARSPSLPEVPTVAESGFPNFEVLTWYGLFAPKNTPKPVIGRINSEVDLALKSPEVRSKFAQQGLTVLGTNADQFAAFMKAEVPKWSTVVRAAGVRPD